MFVMVLSYFRKRIFERRNWAFLIFSPSVLIFGDTFTTAFSIRFSVLRPRSDRLKVTVWTMAMNMRVLRWILKNR